MKNLLLARNVLTATMIVLLPATVVAVERLSLERDGKSIHVDGRIVVEATDGGLLLQDDSGVLWAITPDEIVSRDSDSLPFEPLDGDAIGKDLLKELPAGFRIHKTAHYVLCYNTSPAYAHWCGALFERLHTAFSNYWSRQGFELHEPEWPLVAVILDSKRSYVNYAKAEVGQAAAATIGYYSLTTNRMIMYDLTGAGGAASRRVSTANINRILSRPGVERTVATIIHEATHQVAFNCGLQTRYADIPLWVSEGIAIYFETPDLKSRKGWSGIGNVNRLRFDDLNRYLRNRPPDSLQTLLSNDERFGNPRTAAQAYAEAWALNYFLIHKHSDQYLAYLRTLSEKGPLRYDSPEERLALFRRTFGELDKVDKAFLTYTRNLLAKERGRR